MGAVVASAVIMLALAFNWNTDSELDIVLLLM